MPQRPFVPPAPGLVVWRVSYVRRDVDPCWLATLERDLGVPIELLGAAVEAVEGSPAGHVTIAVPSDVDDLPGMLAPRGLHAARVEARVLEAVG